MRWIRLDTSFDDSPWVFVISPESQLAWVKLLCYVKSYGVRGRCKMLSNIIASKRWGVGEESISKMIQAGINDGAIALTDTEWIIVNWAKFQGEDTTNAERQRRFKDARKVTGGNGVTEEVTGGNGPVTAGNTTNCRVTETLTPTETLTRTVKKESVPRKRFTSPTIEEWTTHGTGLGLPDSECQKSWNFYEAKGWKVGSQPMVKWRAALSTCFLRWKEGSNGGGGPRRGKHIDLDEYAAKKAAEREAAGVIYDEDPSL